MKSLSEIIRLPQLRLLGLAGAGTFLARNVKAWHVVGVGTAGAVATVDDPVATAQMCKNVPLRLGRDIWTAAAIVTDYKRSLRGLDQGPEREAAKRHCHQRSANRMLDLCFKNGGIYIKLGQHLGQLDYVLPEEYVVTMRDHLLDRCPVSDPDEVRRIIEADLGRPVEEVFPVFEWKPIASASLAQVHVAYSASGEKLAVKVQHEGLRESSAADIATLGALVTCVKLVFPDFDYGWLVEETRLNLPKELDFEHEAANAERCRVNLCSPASNLRRKVHIPSIRHELTSPRVLTMEFIEGVKVTDREGLKELGASPAAVARVISETFNEMIFRHGDVHCDPHVANMLVRRKPSSSQATAATTVVPPSVSSTAPGSDAVPALWGAPSAGGGRADSGEGASVSGQGIIGIGGGWELVLLDHGLYRQVDDDTRHHYAGLWRSLIFGDAQGIKRHATALNAGDAYPVFASMLTARPWDEITSGSSGGGQGGKDRLAIPLTQENKDRISDFASRNVRQINDLLANMPRALLLLLKTNDCLRSVDLCLGQPVNTFTIMARECTRALARDRAASHPGFASSLVALEERARVELRVALMQVAIWLHSLRQGVARLLSTTLRAAPSQQQPAQQTAAA